MLGLFKKREIQLEEQLNDDGKSEYKPTPRKEFLDLLNQKLIEIYHVSFQCRKIHLFDRYYYVIQYNGEFYEYQYPCVIAVSTQDLGDFPLNHTITREDFDDYEVVIPVSNELVHMDEYEHFVTNFGAIRDEFKKFDTELCAERDRKNEERDNKYRMMISMMSDL